MHVTPNQCSRAHNQGKTLFKPGTPSLHPLLQLASPSPSSSFSPSLHHLLQLPSVHHLLQRRPRILVFRWVTPRVIPSPGVIHLNNRMTINDTPLLSYGKPLLSIFTSIHDHHHHHHIELENSFAKSIWLDKFSEWQYSTHWVNRLHMSLANLHPI